MNFAASLADELNCIKNAKLKQITKHKIRNLVHEALNVRDARRLVDPDTSCHVL
jgi:hypothetical protein